MHKMELKILENVERSMHQVTFPPQAWTFLHLCFTCILINTLSMISTLMFPLKSIQIPLSVPPTTYPSMSTSTYSLEAHSSTVPLPHSPPSQGLALPGCSLFSPLHPSSLLQIRPEATRPPNRAKPHGKLYHASCLPFQLPPDWSNPYPVPSPRKCRQKPEPGSDFNVF